MKSLFGTMLLVLVFLVSAIIYTFKLYIAIKNGYIESPSNPRKLLTGIPYYLKVIYYFVIIILGYIVFGYFIYFDFYK